MLVGQSGMGKSTLGQLMVRFYDQHATLGDLLVILTNLTEDTVTEMMCHPGYPDEHLATSGYTDRRAEEVV